MPPRQYDFQGLMNSFAGSVNTFTGIADEQMKEQARADLLNMQANFEIEANRFMQELNNRSDFQNWQTSFDEFIKKQGDALQKNSRNMYTAKAANEMLQNYSVNLRSNIENRINSKINENILNRNDQTRQLYDTYKSGQDLIDSKANTFNIEALKGLRDQANYSAEIQKTVSDTYYNHYKNIGRELLQKAIEKGSGFVEIQKAIDADDTVYQAKEVDLSRTTIDDYNNGEAAYKDISNLIDIKGQKAAAIKELQQEYNAGIRDMQKGNANELSQLNTKIERIESESERLKAYKTALYMLDTQYSGLKLGEEDRNEYTRMWKSQVEKIGNTGVDGTGANVSFSTFIKDGFTGFMLQANLGNFSNMYEAFGTYMQKIENDFLNNSFKENKGMNKDERRVYWERNLKNACMGDILNSQELTGIIASEHPSLYGEYKRLTEDLKKNPEAYEAGTDTYIKELMIDLYMSSNGKSDKAQMQEKIKQQIALCEVGKLQKAMKTSLTKQLGTLEDSDVVYTDKYGNRQWLPNGEEEAMNTAKKLTEEILKQTGIEVSFEQWETTPDDVNSIPIFTDENGNRYKAVTVRDKKGNARTIQVVDMNGNVVTKGKNYMSQLDKEAKQAAGKEKQNARAVRREKEYPYENPVLHWDE